jgi:TP901 family phage tail tape measure protein
MGNMADLDAVARLRFIAEGSRAVIEQLEQIKEGSLDLDKGLDKAQKSLEGLAQRADKMAGSAKSAGDALGKTRADASKAADGWDELAKSISGVQDATRAAAKADFVSKYGAGSVSAQPVQQMGKPQLQSYLAAYDASTASAVTMARQRLAELDTEAARFADKTSPRLRYALYDVASSATVSAAALTAAGTSVGVMAAQYESAFTNVERTLDNVSSGKVEKLREQLIGLTKEIPLAFTDIAGIATLGNQLGIASGDVAAFTETVAQFSAVTGMTAEASAQAFGGLGELLNVSASEYERLGSSIALVGRRSVATEQEIVTMTTRLAASASNAGFTAQQVVALSGAFASLRIAPERAQGVMEVYFSKLNTAIATGNESLDAFAYYAGVSTSEVEALVRTDPVAFFERLSRGIGQLDQISQTTALQQLGLDGIRAGEVFGRVSANVGVFNKALADSNQGWSEGTELGKQYALVVDDLASRWQIFLNAVMTAGAAVGQVLAPAMIAVLDVLSQMLTGFSALAENPFGQAIIVIAGAIGALVAAMSAAVAGGALLGGSLLAIRLALVEFGLASVGATTGVRGLIGGMVGLTTATGGAAIALRIFRVVLASTGIGLAVVLVGTLASAFIDLGAVAIQLQGPFHFLIDVMANVVRALMYTGRAIAQVLSRIPLIGDKFKGAANASDGFIESITDVSRQIAHMSLDNWVSDLNKSEVAGSSLNNTLDGMGGLAEEAGTGLGAMGDGAAAAAKEVRTLVDYGNDLQGVFNRSFDLQFGSSQAFDTISTGWSAISKAAAEAREEAEKYRAEMSGLASDRAIKEYWLTVAENYKDTLRAGKLRAELADLDNDQTAAQKKLTAAQDKTNKTLEGNSDAAIANRAELLGLVGNYQNYLQVLASSGMSQAELQVESQRLRDEFIRQATQMGYNRSEIDRYATAFDNMTLAIQRVPRNITVSADVNPALQALNEFEARGLAVASSVGNALGNAFGGGSGGFNTSEGEAAARKVGRRAILLAEIAVLQAEALTYALQGNVFQTLGAKTGIVVKQAILASGAYRSGGYTGNGGVNDVAGVVHGKEFVMSAPAVKNAGGPNAMAYMHNALKSGKGFGPVGIGSGGSGMVELSPFDRQLLVDIRDSVGITIPGQTLQAVTNGANANAAQRRAG